MLPVRFPRKPDWEIEPFEDAFDKMVDRFFRGYPFRGTLKPFKEWRPAVDLIERKDHFLLRANLPGITKEDIEISVSDDYISLSGEIKKEMEEKKDNYYRTERYSGSFARTIPLPKEVDTNKVDATLRDGILEVKLPKKKVSKTKKVSIKIQ